MKPSEIIKQDSEKRGLNPAQILIGVNYFIQKRHAILLHKDKSALLLEQLEPHVYATHLFTIDSPLSLSKAMISFFHDIERMQIQAIYGNADNPQIINLLKQLAVREHTAVETPDRNGYNWMIRL